MGAALDLFSTLFFSKHKISGTWWQKFSLSYKLVIPWKTSHHQAYSTKPVFHKVLLIGIILHSHLLIFCWLRPLSAFPMTMPGINAKITVSCVIPLAFWNIGPTFAFRALLLFFSFVFYSLLPLPFFRIFPELKGSSEDSSAGSYVPLGYKVLRPTDLK